MTCRRCFRKMFRCRSQSAWILILFQFFFIAVLYDMLNSQQSSLSLRQARVNVNIISLQRLENPDDGKSLPQDPETPPPFNLSSDRSTNVTAKTSRSRSTSVNTDTTGTTLLTFSNSSATRTFTTFLLIMVPILPSSFRSRDMIRSTWYKGRTDSEDTMLRFALGIKGIDANVTEQLVVENNTYHDLLFFDNLKENKSVLTNKTLMLMQWAYSNVNFTYFLKCDDDTYVFVHRMLNELKKRPTTKRLYYGVIDSKGRPKKVNDSNMWSDYGWDIADTYLPYALGGGYILSSDLVSLIVEDRQYLRWHPNEDTAVGSWLAPYQFERRHDKLICIMFFNKKKSKKCPQYHIMHLFFGVKREELDKIFIEYSKLDN